MKQALHIIKKDARRLRWAMLVWILIAAVNAGLMVARPIFELQGFGVVMVIGQLTSLISLVELVMMVLIVSWLVHEDPAVDREAFWLTRPIDGRRLSLAKIALATGILICVPLVAQLVVMRIFGLTAYDMARAMPSMLLSQATWIMALLAVAALTPSLSRYAVVLVGVAAAFVLLMSTMIATAVLFSDITSSTGRPQVIDPLPALITAIVANALCVAIVFFEYQYRRVKPGAAILASGALIIFLLPMVGPFRGRQLSDPDPGPWLHDQARVALQVGSEPPNVSDEMAFGRRGESKKRIAIPLQLSGLPDDFYVQAVEVRSRFDATNGTVLSTAAEMVPVRRSAPSDIGEHGELAAMQGALGKMPVRGRESVDEHVLWPVLLSLTDQQFARFGRVAGRLTATLDFYLARASVADAVPLAEPRSMKDARRRIDIVGIDRQDDACTVDLRVVSVGAAFHRRYFSRDEFVLRNTGKREAVSPGMYSGGTHSTNALGFLFGMASGGGGYGASANPDGPGFSAVGFRYRFPQAGVRGEGSPVIDAGWLAGADLVKIHIAYAGHVTRSLTIDNFRMVQ
jgi:hypothetical protein